MKTGNRQGYDYDAVIIGSGIGGLVTAAYLARSGVRVLVCEQHRQPGGYFTSFKRKGYTFDGGIQACEDCGMLLSMLEQLGIRDRIELHRRNTGFVFQSFSLIPRTSALENVELPLLYAGRAGARKEAMESLDLVGLSGRVNHEPSQLSGGELQRVAIARALVAKPSILLADEPTGNLDTRTSEEVLRIFEELNRNGLTTIVVTHDPEVASRCERVLSLVDGKIVSDTRNRNK